MGGGEEDRRRRTRLEAGSVAVGLKRRRLAAAVGSVPPGEIAAALQGASAVLESVRARGTDVVWTGPATPHVPVRLTAQALREVIDAGRDRLIIASFAVYRVETVAEALVRAGERGTRIDLILESVVESAGRITFDGAGGLGKAALAACHLYTWPADRRPTDNGRVAALHAKFAVADETRLLVTSANLTGHALALNMELGLLVTGGEAPRAVVRLVDGLIEQGDLRPFVPRAGTKNGS